MNSNHTNRFQDFFADQAYTALKNCLYNYLLRKRAIRKALRGEGAARILEVGSGMSPVVTDRDGVVYTDLSWLALRNLRNNCGKGWYVAADAVHLPFRTEHFSCVVSSEVMEHIPDDEGAIREMARVTEPSGTAVVTFPHRRFYFARDDRFVHHLRRYELNEMVEKLQDAGLHTTAIRKILGPLEKITMCIAVPCYSLLGKRTGAAGGRMPPRLMVLLFMWANILYAAIAGLDAVLMPRVLSSVLLIKAVKEGNRNRGDSVCQKRHAKKCQKRLDKRIAIGQSPPPVLSVLP